MFYPSCRIFSIHTFFPLCSFFKSHYVRFQLTATILWLTNEQRLFIRKYKVLHRTLYITCNTTIKSTVKLDSQCGKVRYQNCYKVIYHQQQRHQFPVFYFSFVFFASTHLLFSKTFSFYLLCHLFNFLAVYSL